MSQHTVPRERVGSEGPGRDLRKAWIAVVLIPVMFVVVMVIGEFVVAALGYGGSQTPPVGVRAAVGVPATLLLVAPGVIAGVCGLRARRAGEPRGLVPGVIGIAAAAILLVQWIAPLIASG